MGHTTFRNAGVGFVLHSVFLSILIVFLSSCGSSRKYSETYSVSESSSSINSSLTENAKAYLHRTDISSVYENIEFRKVVFDTSKQTDPVTGKHPVLSEISGRLEKSKDNKRMDKTVESVIKNDKLNVFYSRSDSIVSVDIKEKKETTLLSQIKELVFTGCGMVILLVAFRIIVFFMKKKTE